MEIVRGLQKTGIKADLIALGNFDGVHLGHQSVISAMVDEARQSGGSNVVVTFEPHTQKILSPQKPVKLLSTPDIKSLLVDRLGVERMVFLPFDERMASLSPWDFADSVLGQLFHPRKIFVGYNFSFGRGGKGTPRLLKECGSKLGFEVDICPPVKVGSQRVSSTAIRGLLVRGDIARAKELLGHYPVLEGRVIAGNGLGSKLGFPTANLSLPSELLLPRGGVYSGYVSTRFGEFLGVANVGRKPTVSKKRVLGMEVHLLEFSGDLRDEQLFFLLVERLRDEKEFENLDSLIQQIDRDVQRTKLLKVRAAVEKGSARDFHHEGGQNVK